MPNIMNQEGNFRVLIDEYEIKERESGALCISTRAKVIDRWIPPTNEADGYWEPWAEHDVVVYGDFYIVLSDAKANKINDKHVKALVEYAGWNGALPSIEDNTWVPTPCRVSVEGDTYNDETKYRMSWLYSFDSTPGGGKKLDAATMTRLMAKHSASLRAIAGNVVRNKTAPTELPAATVPPAPAPPAPPTPDVNAELAQEAVPIDNVPF